jgi:hypothetical protein
VKASELIAKLQGLIKEHGDLDVVLTDYEYGGTEDIEYVIRDAVLDSQTKQPHISIG